MAKTTKLLGVEAKRGAKMKQGKGWRLVRGKLAFKATLIRRFNVGDESVAVFRVLPIPETQEEQAERERWQSEAGKKAAKSRKRAAKAA